MKEHWDSQPRILFQPLLYRIREFRHLAGATSLARTRHLSQAILQQHCGALGKEISFLVNKHRLRIGMKLAILPGAFELRDLFFQGHARNQIGNPLLNRQLGILIRKLLRRSGDPRKSNNHNHHHAVLNGCVSALLSHSVLQQLACILASPWYYITRR